MASNGRDRPHRHEDTHSPSHSPRVIPQESQATESPSEAMINYNSSKEKNKCQYHPCQKKYSKKKHLMEHIRAKHTGNGHCCTKCQRQFNYKNVATRHEKTCNGKTDHSCALCQKKCSSSQGLRRHMQLHDRDKNVKGRKRKNPQPPSTYSSKPKSSKTTVFCKQYRCRRCAEAFDNRHDLYVHGMRNHYQVGGAMQLQRRPWGQHDLLPWQLEDGTTDKALLEIYNTNAPLILQPHRPGPIQSVYNFPINNEVSTNQLMDFADTVFQEQHHAIRLNIVFGVILRNREMGEYRYFAPYTKIGVLKQPLYVSRRTDLQRFLTQLEHIDITAELLKDRPDTKWIPVLVTNVLFTVWSTYYPIGQGQLPHYLMKKDSLYPLVKNQQTGKPYNDHLCAFRCLALHRGYDIKGIEGPARDFFCQWMSAKEDKYFDGLAIDEFPKFETTFGVNIEVYLMEEDGFTRSVYKSRGKQESTMYVNLYDNHMSYIRDFAMFAEKYQCQTCDRHFNHAGHLHRHQQICDKKTTYVYPGGFYRLKDSIFEQLDQYSIKVPQEDRTFPWFICYDFEAILEKVEERPTESLEWNQQHVPISVSLCSNVDEHRKPICFVNPNPDSLVQCMVLAMGEIADTVFKLAKNKWGEVLEAIEDKIKQDRNQENRIFNEDDKKTTDWEDGGDVKIPAHPLSKVYTQLMNYMTQVPVIGFNSAKYDLNLIKRSLAKHLKMHESKEAFVIKKDHNTYVCIATDKLKFLDMSQYLAAGSSYADFLKANGVAEQKGFFPYDWFDSVEKLKYPTLPDRACFYNQLKDANISEADYVYCQEEWKKQSMTTFRDFLIWYNNLDVGPFMEAIESFQKFYFDKEIDVFKTAISVPGIARQLLFRAAKEDKANFALFDSNSADLYNTVKANIVGGPSIIFTRHHCTGQTFIRGQKPCGSILGFDANALYLQCIGQPMPVGPFIRRFAKNDFRPKVRDRYMSAYYWMDWYAHLKNVYIKHKLNTGSEVFVGPYPVDGYANATHPDEKPMVFQFHGCYWHGHQCKVTRGIKDKKWKASSQSKHKKTLEISNFIRTNHQLVEIWECEFRQYCDVTPEINDFINSMRPSFFRQYKDKTKEDEILRGVVEGTLFGMVEVDICVPEEWPRDYHRQHEMSPYDCFQEMSPIFCNSVVTFDDIGEHMQAHIRENHLSDKPRRQLVGGMRARQILLATPLLRWYLNHGLQVTRIYQVVEFQAQRCFRKFVTEVSQARRRGDIDKTTTIIADTMKVIGNSGYGSLIMDKTKHRDTKYVQGENQTSLKVNEPHFRSLECLDQEEQYYEIQLAKKKIRLDLPIQLGFFILQYAKLRMLEFYYDFMDVYVDRSDFEYCEMDTDSAYMAISGSKLEDVIKPEMRQKYAQGLNGFHSEDEVEADAEYHWFPRTCCSNHALYDKRTPGLFKLEYQGDEMIGLCSKTYIVKKIKNYKPSATRMVAFKLLRRSLGLQRKQCPFRSRKYPELKLSSKGISKRYIKAPMTQFRSVLTSGKAKSGKNRGFRVRRNGIFTYIQERRGFSYLYVKRKVLEDGIHTEPLSIMLCPLPPQD